nr:MAG TPA: hypothetical protein [Bacteriophage sp.]
MLTCQQLHRYRETHGRVLMYAFARFPGNLKEL